MRYRTPASYRRLLFLFSAIINAFCCSAQTLSNASVPVDSSQIVYTPFLCDSGDACNGGWARRQEGSEVEVFTPGPSANDAYIIPQMFLRFRASTIIMMTSQDSTASANVTISTPDGRQVSTKVNTTIGNIVVSNLDETMETSLVVTYLPQDNMSGSQRILGIQRILLTISGNVTATASFLPSATLPPATMLPTFTPTVTPTPGSQRSMSEQQKLALEIGLPVGIGLGLTLLAVLAFLWRRRLQRRRKPPESEDPTFEPSMRSINYSQHPAVWERRSVRREDQSWF
ncbi:hypothetical protein DL96DRAFT_1535949 [Flagelloscypha sp. PMI_526]|nr:hypothetical protein DL96DRAFT_1535949 [Flagelloscypha sp. PMI_526]